ncbi:MAG: ATP-binding protein [Candidatus Aenigmarchaeota archaeon]|nr:ATP-binding protein [Candidatus Aenigmarchaeota archaeon]
MKEVYVERDLEKKVRKYLKRKEILAIVGARQCGKTTLMKRIFEGLENAMFITFEDREILELFAEDTNLFIKKYVEGIDYLFIDEFQYARKGGKILKFIYDTHSTKIIISGSSVAELSVQSLKFLVGRIFVFTLAPFSFGEFLRYRDSNLYAMLTKGGLTKKSVEFINRFYDEYVIYGGYPAVVLAGTEDEKAEVLKGIINTYLLREIKEIMQISDDYKVSKLIKALSLQIGGLVNYSELSQLTGFRQYELAKYMSVLRNTFVCLESRPFFRNKRKELVKAPRMYFLDNGFRNAAIGNFMDVGMRTDRGVLNENFVASEIFKAGIELHYWRTKAGAEVDFIAEKGGFTIPVEVKTVISNEKYTRSFRNFISDYKPRKGIILSRSFMKEAGLNGTDVIFAPLFSVAHALQGQPRGAQLPSPMP